MPAPTKSAEVLARFRGEDEAARRIRNASNEIVRVRINSDDERRRAAHFGTIVEDYGSFAIVARSKGTSAKNYGLEEEIVETTVNLPGAKFEPVTDRPRVRFDSERVPQPVAPAITSFSSVRTATMSAEVDQRRRGVECCSTFRTRHTLFIADAELLQGRRPFPNQVDRRI